MSPALLDFVARDLQVDAESVFVMDGMLGLSDTSELIVDDRPDLMFVPYNPRFPERIRDFGGNSFAENRANEFVVHHPSKTFYVVVQFLSQAANATAVVPLQHTHHHHHQ